MNATETRGREAGPTRLPGLRLLSHPAVVVAGLVVVAVLLAVYTLHIENGTVSHRYRTDTDVYRLGALQWLAERPLYGELAAFRRGEPLPFTYPPFAAILFAPLTWMPMPTASAVFDIGVVLALAAVVALTTHRLFAVTGRRLVAVSVPLTAVALAFEPVANTIMYGQVNLVLMLLVLLDLLPRRTPWPRGVLIGIAAAFKLTPAVFILYFVVRRDVRGTLTTAAAAAACTLGAAAILPRDSWEYFTHTLRNSERIGEPSAPINQSLSGTVSRLFGSAHATGPAWILVVLVALAALIALMVRLDRAGLLPELVVTTALVALLCSPISWSHHWVWMVPTVAVLLRRAVVDHDRLPAVIAGIGLLLALVWLPWAIPPHDRWTGVLGPVWQLLGSSYLLWGIAVLVYLYIRTHHGRTTT